jgi:nucleotide-binding universal stress UspA family protein
MARTVRILHPSDFSPASSGALTKAVELAKKDDAELVLAHVLTPVAPLVGEAYVSPKTFDEIQRSSREQGERRLDALAAKARKAGVRVQTVLAEGVAWQEITRLAKARRVDLIVMGTHGRGGLAKLFLGSVAERVVATAPCPVMTVRGR